MSAATKQVPATPLPWYVGGATTGRFPSYPIRGPEELQVASLDIHARGGSHMDAAYLAHAANAYPNLVKALADIENDAMDEGGDQLYVNKKLIEAARATLRKLGEAS